MASDRIPLSLAAALLVLLLATQCPPALCQNSYPARSFGAPSEYFVNDREAFGVANTAATSSGSFLSRLLETAADAKNNEIPTSLLIRLSSVQTPEDFINSFVVGAPDRIRTDSSSRKENVPGLRPLPPGSGNGGFETSLSNRFDSATDTFSITGGPQTPVYEDKIATFATCQVRPTIVDVPVPTNAAELRWPSCVEVNRCRGCCSDYMACNSTGVEIVYKKVYRVRYEGANSEYFTYVGEEHVPIETHKQNSCVCACKIPASECGPNQIYEDCQCKCVNGNEASSCRYPHEWNKSLCQCRCPVITGCATGQVFNHNTCSCDVDPNAAMTAGDDTALFSVFSPGT